MEDGISQQPQHAAVTASSLQQTSATADAIQQTCLPQRSAPTARLQHETSKGRAVCQQQTFHHGSVGGAGLQGFKASLPNKLGQHSLKPDQHSPKMAQHRAHIANIALRQANIAPRWANISAPHPPTIFPLPPVSAGARLSGVSLYPGAGPRGRRPTRPQPVPLSEAFGGIEARPPCRRPPPPRKQRKLGGTSGEPGGNLVGFFHGFCVSSFFW